MARRTSFRSSRPRRRNFWARIMNWTEVEPGDPTFATRFNALAQFENEYGADLFGFTITRIRGMVSVNHDTTSPVERREFTFGIRVASDQGTTSVGDLPSANPHEDWMYTLSDPNQITNASEWQEYRYPLDLKGQRRLDELGQGLYVYTGFSSLSGTPLIGSAAQIGVELNVLCKRP